MGRAASRYVASPTPKRRSADTSPTLLRSGASQPFIAGTYNGCVYYPLRAAGPKTRDRAPPLMSKKHTRFVIIENPHPDGKRYTTAKCAGDYGRARRGWWAGWWGPGRRQNL